MNAIFSKYGAIDKCQIVLDPHTRESRGFAFVTMVEVADAEAAVEALNNFEVEGRAMSVAKAKRARPRTPTPGQYHGPAARDSRRGDRGG